MLEAFTAVILTGGSSGIGKSFLEHVGKLHPHLVFCNLSRREPPRERALLNELKLRHVGCDLADSRQIGEAMDRVLAILQHEAPTGQVLLINNAGFGGYGVFPAPGQAAVLGMVDVNVRAVVDLTARCLPLLRERGGGIINVASTAAFQPTAYLATYGATKAFVLHWSLALAEELRGTRVRVLTACPGPTRTEFFRRAGLVGEHGALARGQSSEAVVAEVLAAWRRGDRLVVTGWRNKLLAALGGSAPRTWSARVGAAILRRVRGGGGPSA